MTFFEAILSGIVQGITEFLPISSSGHLVILHKLIGLKEPQLGFDIFLHAGTLIAIFIIFRNYILDFFTTKKRLGLFVLMGTAVTVFFVFLFGGLIEGAFSDVRIVGAMLIVTGAWLILGNLVRFDTGPLTGFKAILIGLAQGISAFPGISRSGTTISTALFLGMDPKSAARFSFLLAIPAIVAAFFFKTREVVFTGFDPNYIFGLITSCIVGIMALKLLLRILYKNRFWLFGFYCIFAGVLVLLLL
ncbi:MAG: undecaprenyl-diphosphate phosphatase [Candidatus Omnitrophota bacterium]